MNVYGGATDSAGNPSAWCDEPRLPALPNRRHVAGSGGSGCFATQPGECQHKAGFVSGQERVDGEQLATWSPSSKA